MNREQMCDYIIRRLGFEHKAVVWFFDLLEEYPNATDEKLQRVLEALLDLIELANNLEDIGE